MVQGPNEQYREYYKLNAPEFSSREECIQYVTTPLTNAFLKDHIKTVYPITPVEGVWCVREDVWKKFMSMDNGI